MSWQVDHGDCLAVLRACPSNVVDALVSDPPSGIGFMGKEWDHDRGGREAWVAWLAERAAEALRIMKPGAHGLVWALPRTSHWTATALEDAGFEVRDVVNHLFGTGFPKSLNLGEGVGTALKPAAEHWILVRKPCDGTTTSTFERWGTGGLEIDACRIGEGGQLRREKPRDMGYHGGSDAGPVAALSATVGRWPANVVFSHSEACGDACANDCAVRALDEQAGERKSNGIKAGTKRNGLGYSGSRETTFGREIVSSIGPASRFFYVAKPSPAERDLGLDALPIRTPAELTGSKEGAARLASPRTGAGRSSGRKNHHPTVVVHFEPHGWILDINRVALGASAAEPTGSTMPTVARAARGVRCGRRACGGSSRARRRRAPCFPASGCRPRPSHPRARAGCSPRKPARALGRGREGSAAASLGPLHAPVVAAHVAPQQGAARAVQDRRPLARLRHAAAQPAMSLTRRFRGRLVVRDACRGRCQDQERHGAESSATDTRTAPSRAVTLPVPAQRALLAKRKSARSSAVPASSISTTARKRFPLPSVYTRSIFISGLLTPKGPAPCGVRAKASALAASAVMRNLHNPRFEVGPHGPVLGETPLRVALEPVRPGFLDFARVPRGIPLLGRLGHVGDLVVDCQGDGVGRRVAHALTVSDALPTVKRGAVDFASQPSRRPAASGSNAPTTHPTVKSIALMRWLVRLVTPPGGVVLDPFTGSGTTGCAAVLEGAHFAGIEQDPEYVTIARARIAKAEKI